MRKTGHLSLVLVGVCVGAISGACKPPEEVKPDPGIEVQIREGLLDEVDRKRPDEAAVYEMLPSEPEKWMDRFARLSEIKGDVEDSGELLMMKDGDRYLEVRKTSSAVFAGDMSRLWTEEPSPERSSFDVPDDKVARKIAAEWLQEFGFTGEEIAALDVSVSEEAFEISMPDNPSEPKRIVVGKNVEVRRQINDFRVVGPGSKIKVYIGEGGRVNGYLVVWRQVDPASTKLGHVPGEGEPRTQSVAPLSAHEAFDRLRENPLDHLPLALVDRIQIDDVEFAYYSRSASEKQRYLQPVYVFSGMAHATVSDGETLTVPYEQFVVALPEPFETIWPTLRQFEPLPRPDKPMKVEADEDEIVD